MAPFRIGSTSYVYPDDILPNARALAPIVDDIELVLFEVDEGDAAGASNLPTRHDIAELRTIARDNGLSYTVHLPLNLRFGDAVAFDKARRAIQATRNLEPYAYVMHLDSRALVTPGSADERSAWQRDAGQALAQVVSWVGDPRLVCVENLEGWDPEILTESVLDRDVSRCIDVGHLWVDHRDPLPHLRAHLDRTRVIHLHGIGTRDHQSLVHTPEPEVRRVIRFLLDRSYEGVVTLEVFGVEDFFSSREVLLRLLEQLHE
jgi:sugar phosphate isomerase/epimerase